MWEKKLEAEKYEVQHEAVQNPDVEDDGSIDM
jgi:hypothetical protein